MDSSTANTVNMLADQIVVNGSDVFNYVARYGVSDYQLQMVLVLSGHIDDKQFVQALYASTIVEPVLRCRFMESARPLIWQQREHLDVATWYSVQQTESTAAIDAWLSRPLDMDQDPLVMVHVLRSSTHDTLCLKINHACCDGAGLIRYIQLLASIYGHLSHDPDYQPAPYPVSRDQSQLFQETGILKAGGPVLPPPLPEAPGPSVPFTAGEPGRRRQVIRRIPRTQWNRWASIFRPKGITLNDILLAAYWRSLCQHIESDLLEPVKVTVTANLRRYIPEEKVNTVCNLSGVMHFSPLENAGEDFSATVDTIAAKMKQYKDTQMGLQGAAGFFEILKHLELSMFVKLIQDGITQGLSSKKTTPLFSNFGFISSDTINFGAQEVVDAYIVSPAYYAPGFMLGVSTYQDWMTLTVAFFEPSIETSWVETLLDTLIKDVHSCEI